MNLNLNTMALRVVTPSELRDNINELYYRTVIQHDTPEKVSEVLKEIAEIRQSYEEQEEYELCAVCVELEAEIALEHDVRVANDLADEL